MRPDSARAIALAIAFGFGIAATPLAAQEWHVSAHAGRIRSVLDPSATSGSFALGLRYEDPDAALRLSAGIPGSSNDALWGSVGGWRRFAARFGGNFRTGLDVAGNAFLVMDRSDGSAPLPGPFDPPASPLPDRDGHAVAGQALPMLGYESARFQLHTRAGISRYAAQFGGQPLDRVVRLADLQVTLLPTTSVAIVPVIQTFRASGEDASTYRGVSALAASGPASAWGSIGQWSQNGIGTPWAVGGRWRPHPLIALEVAARHDTFDPLYLQPAQTAWSVGVALRLGGRARPLSPPVPAAYVDGRATIRLPVAASKTQPSIAGDFNDWKPAPMHRDGDQWTYVVNVTPGVYNYAFVSAGGDWFVPESVAGRKSDGMGGHVAVLVVR